MATLFGTNRDNTTLFFLGNSQQFGCDLLPLEKKEWEESGQELFSIENNSVMDDFECELEDIDYLLF